MSSAANQTGKPTVEEEVGPRPAPANDPRTVIGGRYAVDLDAPLGGGGICLVYGGHDLRTRRPIALKTLRLQYRDEPETRARFRREARLLAFLAHPNVVRVFDFVEDRGATWVVLERIDGPSVKELLARRGPLPPAEVAALLDQAAAALAHLHRRGLVHLDVTPQNLLLTADGRLKLIDFGLAQSAGSPQEAVGGKTFGTAAYLAPEQACGDPVDAATDVYALGCVVYELLTGQAPFAVVGSSQGPRADRASPAPKQDVIRARLERVPTAPTRTRPDLRLPPWVDDVVLWALAREPAARYGSAVAFAEVFRARVDGDEPGEGATLVGPPPVAPDRPRPPAATGPARNVYAPLPEPPRPVRLYDAGGRATRRATRLRRALWRGIAMLLVANLLLAVGLFLTRGEVPGLYAPTVAMRPGGTARSTTADLLVREEPGLAAAPVSSLTLGARVELTGEPIPADGELWWPIEASGSGTDLNGYAAGAWLEPVPPTTPWERLSGKVGLDS